MMPWWLEPAGYGPELAATDKDGAPVIRVGTKDWVSYDSRVMWYSTERLESDRQNFGACFVDHSGERVDPASVRIPEDFPPPQVDTN